jgi:hypothetical protein
MLQRVDYICCAGMRTMKRKMGSKMAPGVFYIICTHTRPFRPPLWSSGQSSSLQIQRSGFDSRRYQIFWEVVDLERGPLSIVSTTEELLERKSSGSGLENREYGLRDPSCWPRGTLYPQKLAITPLTSGGGSVGIIRSRTQTTECRFGRWSTLCEISS